MRTAKTLIRRMPRLIWVFAGCTCHFVGFVVMRLSYLIPLMLLSSTYNHTSWQNPCIWLVDRRHPCHHPHQSWLSLYSIANLLYPAEKPHSSCWPGKTPVLLLVIKWWRRHDLVAFCFEVFQCHYTLHTDSGWWWMNLENNTPIVKPSELPCDKTNKMACASTQSDQSLRSALNG